MLVDIRLVTVGASGQLTYAEPNWTSGNSANSGTSTTTTLLGNTSAGNTRASSLPSSSPTANGTVLANVIKGVVFEGDSITYGYDSSNPATKSFPAVFGANTGLPISDQGLSGDTLSNMDSQYTANDAPLYNSSTLNTFFISAGTNDLAANNSTDTQLIGWMQSIMGKAHTTGFVRGVGTITPRSTNWTSQMETYRVSYNNWLRSNWQTIAEYFVDWETVSQLTNPTNTTYYVDGIHPTDAGYALMAGKVQVVLGVPNYVPTTYTLTGPTTITVGVVATYTVAVSGALASSAEVMPSDSSAGGKFSPTSVTLGTSANASATLTYTAAAAGSISISTTNGGSLTNPSAIVVTASAPAATNYVRLTTLSKLSEAVNGAGGYNYTSTGIDGDYSAAFGVSSIALPASADGWVAAKLTSTAGTGLVIGLKASASNGNYSSLDFGLYHNNGYGTITSGSGGGALDTAFTPAAGDLVRVRRTAGVVYGEVSTNNGSTFTVVKTWSGSSTAKLYIGLQSPNPACPINQPLASSNVV